MKKSLLICILFWCIISGPFAVKVAAQSGFGKTNMVSTLFNDDVVNAHPLGNPALLWGNNTHFAYSSSGSPIMGDSALCAGSSTTFTDSTSGGTWKCSDTARAGIDSVTGVVTGIATGTVIITYHVDSIYITKTLTIEALPGAGMIVGLDSLCAGGTTIALSDSIPGGTWSATDSSASVVGGVVTGITPGIDTIIYSVSNVCGTTRARKAINVMGAPDPGIISSMDSFTVCLGSSIALSESVAGGTWSEQNGNTSVSSTGIVSGINSGVDSVLYTVSNGCGSAYTEAELNILAPPSSVSIAGLSNLLCVGSLTSGFTSLTATVPGGTWSSSSMFTALVFGGYVVGLTPGTATISYTITNTCGTGTATYPITVMPMPNAGRITGPTSVCQGAVILLSDTAMGGMGIWYSQDGNTSVTGGVVTGVHAGQDSVHYQIMNVCGMADAAIGINIQPSPVPAPISGPVTVCIGSTITLADTSSGGIWYAQDGNTTVSAGIVTGVHIGQDSVHYHVTNACGTGDQAVNIMVDSLPAPVIVRSGDTLYTTTPFATYQWMQAGSSTVLGTDSYLLVTDTGTYVVTVTNASGCSASNAFFNTGDAVPMVKGGSNEISVYPNPASAIVYIRSLEAVSSSLYSIDGRMIIAKQSGKSTDISQLPAGVYVLNIYSAASGTLLKTVKIEKLGE